MDLMVLSNIITTVGFPIAMCIYLLVKQDKVIQNNTDAIRSIERIIDKCEKKP